MRHYQFDHEDFTRLLSDISGDMTTFFQGSSTQSTKVVGKSINPHYDSKMHFMGVTRDIFIATSVHAKILGELQLCRKL